MKLVSVIINHILIPLWTIIFVIIGGIGASGLSAIIEYYVLKEMFVSEYNELLPAPMIALSLVLILELSKLYLHFLYGKLAVVNVNTRMNIGAFRTAIHHILVFLVALSFICTMIYTVNVFHLSAYNEGNISKQIKAINEQLEEDIDNVAVKHETAYTIALEPYLKNMNNANDAVASFDPKGMGPMAIEATLSSLRKASEKATSDYDAAQERLALERDNNIATDSAELEAAAQEKIRELSNISSPEIAAKYDNKVLSQFLLVIAQTLFKEVAYSRIVYLSISLLFSIGLAAILEVLISVCFKFLSFPMECLIDNQIKDNKKLLEWCDSLVLVLLRTFVAISVCVIITFICAVHIQKTEFFVALISCLIAILITQKLVVKVEPISNRNSKETLLTEALKSSISEGIVSFILYVMAGFFFGKEAVNIDLTTFAVSVGSAFSGIIGYVPQYIARSLLASSSKGASDTKED